MTNRRTELFQAVLDDPNADEPRFAFAEWLDAQGDPQGEFIRLQIAESRRYRSGGSDEAEDRGRIASLLEQHGQEWSRPIAEMVTTIRFFRGFVEGITCDGAAFASRAAEMYTRAPVRHLTLNNAKPYVQEIASSPHLAQLSTLAPFGNGLDDRELQFILDSKYVAHVKSLNLGFNNLTMRGVEAICASKNLPALVHVNLSGNAGVTNPIEEFGTDWMSGRIVREGIALPEAGRRLEEAHGYQAWLHGPSRLIHWPPVEDDF